MSCWSIATSCRHRAYIIALFCLVTACGNIKSTSATTSDISPISSADLSSARNASELSAAHSLPPGTGHRQKVIDLLTKAADQGNPVAQVELAHTMERGTVSAEDEQKVLQLYQLSAHRGYAAGEIELGDIYRRKGTSEDAVIATYWYRQAALQENVTGMCLYGLALVQGNGTPQDKTTGEHYLEKVRTADAFMGAELDLNRDIDQALNQSGTRLSAQQRNAIAAQDESVCRRPGDFDE